MPIEVEVSLRLPNAKVRTLDEKGFPIDHATVRFKRRMVVAALPAVGSVLQLETRSGRQVASEVLRSDWSDADELFVLACRHVGRSMPPEEREAILADSSWQMRPLI
jgi:hypothetical protein